MPWPQQRGPRQGARRLPERQRQRILRRYPTCTLNIPGICTHTSTQVDHIRPAADFPPGENPDHDSNLRGVCKPCHTRASARYSAKRAWNWKRTPEPHPGILD